MIKAYRRSRKKKELFMKREEVRWGILGKANISSRVVSALLAGGSGVLRAVASRDEAKARAWAVETGAKLSFGSYGDLIGSGEVDAVYIPLPNTLHREWAVKALEAGCNVLCEKPLAMSAAEAKEISGAAGRNGRHVAEAFMYRHHPQWDVVMSCIKSGSIGKIRSIYSRFTFMNDDPASVTASAELGGGALLDVGCYCVDASRLLMGCDPARVSAFERRSDVDEMLLGMMEFPGGVTAQFECGIDTFERHLFEVNGTEGSIVMESPWVPGMEAPVVKLMQNDSPARVLRTQAVDPYAMEVCEFAAVCAGEAAARWPVAWSVGNMKTIDALFISAKEGRIVDVE
jgi:predicted dehydrogenase